MPEPTVDVAKFVGAVNRMLQGSVVGYSGVIGAATGTPQKFTHGQARTSADPQAAPVTTSTQFGIASVSKLLTALAAVQLLDGPTFDGSVVPPNALGLTLDSPMYEALPKGWNVQDAAVKKITFRQLLTHTSGMAPEGSSGEPGQDYASLETYITQPQVPLVPLAPGATAYSNVGYAFFRVLLPILSGQQDNPAWPPNNRAAGFAATYQRIIGKNVFAAVGVNRLGPNTETPKDGNYAFSYAFPGSTHGYDWSTWKYPGQTWPTEGLPLWAGSGCWWVSVDEITPVLDSLNRIDGRIVSEQQWLHMQGVDAPPGFEGLGLGLDQLVDSGTGYRWVEKNGGDGGLAASVAFFGSFAAGGTNGPRYAALFVNSDISAPSAQSSWYWCSKCESLFFAGNNAGVCPAGATHAKGGEYILSSAAQPSGQTGWRWCSKCQALCFEPAPTGSPSVCPASGRHACPSGPYVLGEAGLSNLEYQDQWKWCRKCGVLAFSGNGAGVCATGTGHDFTQSGNYSLQQLIGPDTVLLEAFRESAGP